MGGHGMNPSRVDVVLVRPARPANVAAACRAMKNMGLGRLRIVDPPPGLGDPDVRSLAYGAWDVLDAARPAASLLEAVGDAALVVGTSGRALPDAWTPRRLAAEGAARARGGRISLVFGPERSGLTNEELDLCPLRVHIPTSGEHSSLNLAQAVLVVAYEIRVSSTEEPASEGPPVAAAAELEQAVRDLRAGLLEVGYLNPDQPDDVLAEIRRLLARAGPTPREVALLRGLARQIGWAGRKAREGPGIG